MLEDGRHLAADAVVVAVGADTAWPDVPGLSEHTLGLRTVADALAVRRELVEADRLVVVGGGATGVQLAAEAAHRHRHLDVVLVEATPALLPAMPRTARPPRRAHPAPRGVEVRRRAPVTRVTPTGVVLDDGTASTGWSCGPPASPRPAVRLLPEAETIDGRLVVDSSLRVPGTIAVFAAGDVAAHRDLFALPMEMSAQTAVRAGAVAGRNAVRVARALPPSPALLFDMGRLVTMGRRVGVGTVLGLPLAGPLLDRAVPAAARRRRPPAPVPDGRPRRGPAPRPGAPPPDARRPAPGRAATGPQRQLTRTS